MLLSFPLGFIFNVLQGKVTNLDSVNAPSSETVYFPSGHHGGSLPSVPTTPASYTNLKTINSIALANGGFYSARLLDEYTIFLLGLGLMI